MIYRLNMYTQDNISFHKHYLKKAFSLSLKARLNIYSGGILYDPNVLDLIFDPANKELVVRYVSEERKKEAARLIAAAIERYANRR